MNSRKSQALTTTPDWTLTPADLQALSSDGQSSLRVEPSSTGSLQPHLLHPQGAGKSARYRAGAGSPRDYASSSRDEMNLAEFPLAVLSTRVNPALKTLEFTDTHRNANGELVERQWIITGADKFGLPTSTDDDVVLGLMRLSMSQGFRERKVYFTRYELLKTLRWSTEGRSYKRLIRSLDRLSGVRIRSTNSFYDNSSKAYQTCNFGLIDAYEINDERGTRPISEDEVPRSFFIWSEALFDSFKAGYIKKLDLDLYFSLTSAISRRLYRYLDKHFYYKGSIERTLLPFAFEKLGLSRTYKYVSSVRQQLEPALEELIRVGFLSHYEISGRGGASTIRFISSASGQAPARLSQRMQERPAERAENPPPSPGRGREPLPPPMLNAAPHEAFSGASFDFQPAAPTHGQLSAQLPANPDLEALCQRGLARFQAQKLLDGLTPAGRSRIPSLLKYYDHLVQQNDFKVSRNRVGFLYRAIERIEEFQIPAEFGGPGRGAGAAAGQRVRPELRVFGAKDRGVEQQAEQNALKMKQYQEYVSVELARFLSSLTDEETQILYAGVEQKMSCLRSVLTPAKFREAIEGCVREEITRRLKLPRFEAWNG